MSSAYSIIDEPRAGNLAHLSVNPMWPLFAFMVGGVFFSWTWTVLNGIAIGSPTLRREILIVMAGVVLVVGGMVGLEWALNAGLIAKSQLPYARLALITVELAVCYLAYLPQSQAFELHEYYGGKVANGVWGLVLAMFVGPRYQAFIMTMIFGGGQ